MRKKSLILILLVASGIFSFAQPAAFTGCPANNVAIVRPGNNNNTAGPVSIYNVNTSTGATALLSGPIADPADAAKNLQVNGLGLNSVDGFLYGLSANNISILTTNTALPLYKVGANAIALQVGNMPGPSLAAGETQSFVVPAAGEMDPSNNYFFTAATGSLNNTNLSFTVRRLFLGKLTGMSTLPASTTATLAPSYTEITSTDINCVPYLATLKATYTAANASNAAKDLVYDKISGKLYTYVTYPDPANATNFAGLMLLLDPATGILTAVAPPVILPFASASNEVAGTLLDQNGNFLILFTNGAMYKANTSAPGIFNGSIAALNTNTSLPNGLRGDMASCGGASSIVPPVPFTGCPNIDVAVLRAGTNSGTGSASIYTVNTITGTPTLLSGPIADPANTANNLQVNGLGLNTVDGFLYGLNASTTAILTANTALPFYRVGANAVAIQTGNMPGPVRTGGETHSFVNAAAGEMDQSGNYYFSGATGTLSLAGLQVNRVFIGMLPAVSSLTASTTAVLAPSYRIITSSDPNCAAYLASLTATFAPADAANAGNTGLKDLVYDKSSGKLYSYVTYPSPANSTNFAGLMIVLDPATGILTAVAPPVILPFANANNEVAGTLLDKNGNFLILFTNGSIYKAGSPAPGVFDGSIALLNGATGLPSQLRGDMASCGGASEIVKPLPFSGCPATNLAILRAGTNASTTNPLRIYNINSATGTPGLLSGPILDPADASKNLQVNGFGLHTGDGFLYGLKADNISNVTTNTPLPYYRVGANAVALQLGNMPGPALGAGETQSFVIPAAGEMDPAGNYYFTAATGTTDLVSGSFTVKRLFLGKLAAVSLLTGSTTTTLAPSYTEITSTDINCAAYLATLTVTYTAVNAANAANTGIKDLVFDKKSGRLYTYVTYPDPANAGSFVGLMLTLNPGTGALTAVAPPVSLPFVSASNEVAGQLLDQNGNYLILFTDGTIYTANTSSPGIFDGNIAPLNTSTGLPSPLRGDMASCGAAALLPVVLNYFTVYTQQNTGVIQWETASEINTEKFVVERSADGSNWNTIQIIAATGNSSAPVPYRYEDKNIAGNTAYYRLRIVDFNGSFTYSATRKVSLTGTTVQLSYYPNPVKNMLYAESNTAFANNLNLVITDLAGRTHAAPFRKTAANRVSIQLSTLPAGMYFIKITDGTGKHFVQKILKE